MKCTPIAKITAIIEAKTWQNYMRVNNYELHN